MTDRYMSRGENNTDDKDMGTGNKGLPAVWVFFVVCFLKICM